MEVGPIDRAFWSYGLVRLIGTCNGSVITSLGPKPDKKRRRTKTNDEPAGGAAENGSQGALAALSQRLWELDVHRLPGPTYRLNLQGRVRRGGPVTDKAPSKLFTFVDETYFQRASFRTFIALLDNYNIHTKHKEQETREERDEVEVFINTMLQGNLTQTAYHYLRDRGIVSSITQYKQLLRQYWFDLYPRSPKGKVPNSCGFEHVFVGEINDRRNKVIGFHNWIQAYLQEKKRNWDYYGYFTSKQTGVVSLRFAWHSFTKSLTTLFVGTSPEFELALYTVCLATAPSGHCKFKVNGHPLNVDVKDLPNKAGKQVATAYPVG